MGTGKIVIRPVCNFFKTTSKNMDITKIQGATVGNVIWAIEKEFKDSRFSLEVSTKKWGVVSMTKVRVPKKEYCGNHMKACENPNKKHRHGTHLEGADWVEFNDMVNNALDALGVSANVASSKSMGGCIVRKGDRRRIRYESNTRLGSSIVNFAWIVDYDAPADHFECWCGSQIAPPLAWFPEGTPGKHTLMGYSCVG